MSRARFVVTLLFVIAATAPALAASADDEARARVFSSTGVRQYNEGRYDEAIASFEAAYKIVPLPLLVFDIAQAYRLKGDAYCAEALDRYRAFLRAASPRDPNRALAEDFVVQTSACVRSRAASGAPHEPASPETPASTTAQPTEPAPMLTRRASDDQPRGRLALRITGISGLVVGAAMVASGAAFGASAVRDRDELERACTPGCTWSSALAATERDRASAVAKTIALSTVGGVVLVAGAVLSYYGWRGGRDGRRVWIAPALAPGLAGLGAGGAF